MAIKTTAVSTIAERVEFAGTSRLRQFNGRELRKLGSRVIVIQETREPVAVLMSYASYREMERAEPFRQVKP